MGLVDFSDEKQRKFWDIYDRGGDEGKGMSAFKASTEMGWSWDTVQKKTWYQGEMDRRRKLEKIPLSEIQGILAKVIRKVDKSETIDKDDLLVINSYVAIELKDKGKVENIPQMVISDEKPPKNLVEINEIIEKYNIDQEDSKVLRK